MTKTTISKQALKDAIEDFRTNILANGITERESGILDKINRLIDQFEDVKLPSDETIDKEEILSSSEKFFGAMLLTRQFNESQIHNIKRYAILLREEFASQSSSDVRKELEAKEFAEWCGFSQWYMSIMYNPAEWINIDPKIKEHWTTAELYQLFQQHKLSTNIEKK